MLVNRQTVERWIMDEDDNYGMEETGHIYYYIYINNWTQYLQKLVHAIMLSYNGNTPTDVTPVYTLNAA